MIIDEPADGLQLNSRIRSGDNPGADPTAEQLRVLHRTIQAVTEDMLGLRFNTAISRLIEFVNFFTGQENRPLSCMEIFALLLAPLAPHLAEELWQALGHAASLAYEAWPAFNENYTREDTIELPVQINGRLRSRLVASSSANKEELERAALADAKIRKHIEGATVRKVIIVPAATAEHMGVCAIRRRNNSLS